MMEHVRMALLPFLFMAILLLPLVNSIFGIWKYERKEENRNFAVMPTLDINYLDPFPEDFDAYYRDNFSFRTPLLEVYHHFKFYFAKVSPDPTKTVVGKDGWYFMAGDEKNIIEGKSDFTPKQLKAFGKEWSYRMALMDSFGVKECHLMILPITQYVYPEKMEFNTLWSDKPRRVDQLKEYLNGIFPGLVIDPLPQMLAAKDSMKLCYQLDNHCNYKGGFVAAYALIETLQAKFPQLELPKYDAYVWRDTLLRKGHHRAVLGNDSLFEIDFFPFPKNQNWKEAPLFGFPPVAEFPYKNEHEFHFVNTQDNTLPRIVIIRDSFTGLLMPFLNGRFGESVYIFDSWHYHANPKVIAAVKPDIVIYCVMETHLGNIIKVYNEP